MKRLIVFWLAAFANGAPGIIKTCAARSIPVLFYVPGHQEPAPQEGDVWLMAHPGMRVNGTQPVWASDADRAALVAAGCRPVSYLADLDALRAELDAAQED